MATAEIASSPALPGALTGAAHTAFWFDKARPLNELRIDPSPGATRGLGA